MQVFTILVMYTMPGMTLRTFQFTPAGVNGVLSACVGNRISLTCTHDNDATGVTRWIFSPPIDCSETIDHNPPIFTRPCGPFVFNNISRIGSNDLLSSTAITAEASASMSGSVAECRDSSGDVYNQIGIASICIIGKVHDHGLTVPILTLAHKVSQLT